MKDKYIEPQTSKLIKLCHMCNKVTESPKEIERCPFCTKAFLPLNYFEKIHFNPNIKLRELFCTVDELDRENLINGIHVIW